MIFGTLNPEKIYGFVHLTCQMKPLLPQEIQKKSFSTVLFIYTSDYLSYLRRKQTVIHLPTPSENVTTLTCELLNFFIRLKVCCVRVTIFCVNRCFQSFFEAVQSHGTPCCANSAHVATSHCHKPQHVHTSTRAPPVAFRS